jgi:hypothetical protein
MPLAVYPLSAARMIPCLGRNASFRLTPIFFIIEDEQFRDGIANRLKLSDKYLPLWLKISIFSLTPSFF